MARTLRGWLELKSQNEPEEHDDIFAARGAFMRKLGG